MGDETTRTTGLRILAADEDESTLRTIDELLAGLGHEVAAHALNVAQAAEQIAREDPDLSVVVVNADDEHALDLIEEICEYARGPVIALLGAHDSDFVLTAAERGIDAFARAHFDSEVQGAIELALKRHAEKTALAEQVEQLQSALERRGTIERAKGILMERHSVDERRAFELLRQHARRSNRRVVDLAHSITDGHALLPERID
jgi:response regulator NasT